MDERDLKKIRKEKLRQWEKEGIWPFQNKFHLPHPVQEIKEDFWRFQGKEVTVAGRIKSIREHGKSTFLDIQDENTKIQIYFKVDLVGEKTYSLLRLLDIGDHVGIKGEVFKTKTEEITILAQTLTPLTKCLRPLPQKWYGLQNTEKRYRQRYLDLIMNDEVKKIFQLRSHIITIIRAFLNERGFMEVETPMMHLLPGGALARPFITHHNALDIDLYLRIAPELYLKKLVIGGYEKIYEINKSFRNEGISTKHNPEFTMLELYWAYADYEVLKELTEEILRKVVKEVKGKDHFTYKSHPISVGKEWERITYHDAFRNYCGIDIEKNSEEEVKEEAKRREIDSDQPFGRILDSLFKKFIEPHLIQPTFIVDYPVELSPLAKEKKEGIVERFQPFIGGLELGNAYTELNDPREQEKRFKQQVLMRQKGDEEAHPFDRDFITALEFGMPPSGGLGIGIDRLVMLLADVKSIREVILFPLLKGRT